MEITTLDEFIAEIETTFSTYAETNDIDKVSIKTWVIECLRPFITDIFTKRSFSVLAICEATNHKAS